MPLLTNEATFTVVRLQVPVLVRVVILEEARFRVPEPVTSDPILATAKLAAVVTDRLVILAVSRLEVPVLVSVVTFPVVTFAFVTDILGPENDDVDVIV